MSCFVRVASGWMIWLLASSALGHPNHSSYAEIEWSATGQLNVALKIIPEDFERALSTAAGKPVVLIDSQEVRELIESYLDLNFAINTDTEQQGTPCELVLEGMELGYRDTWIYFSIQGDVPTSGTLTNTILFDVQPSQVNRVKALWAPTAATLVFTDREPSRSLVVLTK